MAPVVETGYGRLSGRREGEVLVFRGVPYAAPPVGPLRFCAPRPPASWSGVREAFEFAASPPQNPMLLPLPGMDVGSIDEDCLYLNVYTPARDSGRRPVMVWIHGGGFVVGSGSQSIYDGRHLALRGDVVVVTINYRLGPLGFLFLRDLCGDLEGTTGNAGILDQVAALRWVHEHIGAFGGDPENVTIFGESAGGMSVGTLLGMPQARGLFQRAIAQSGAAHNIHSRDTATQVAERFLEHLGVSPGEAARLRDMPPDRLLDTQQQTLLKLGTTLGALPFQPLVDGDAVPEPPLEAIRRGQAAGVPLLTGTTRDEWKLVGLMDTRLRGLDLPGLEARLSRQLPGADMGRLVAAYRDAREGRLPTDVVALFSAIETDRIFRIPALRLAEAQLVHEPRTFVYQVTWESPALGGALGACHAIELPFVFGVLDQQGPKLFAGQGPEAQRLSECMMDAWIAFARGGEPGHPGLPGGRWDAYDTERRATMMLGRECALELDPREAERRAWEHLL